MLVQIRRIYKHASVSIRQFNTHVSVCVLTEMNAVRCSLLKQQVTVGYEKSVLFVVFPLFYKNTANMISHVKYLYL